MALNLPVFVIERETGHLDIYSTEADVQLVASEFWDILDDDFLFFDATGRRLKFPTHLPNGAQPDVIDESTEERRTLTQALERYGREHGLKWRSTMSVESFLEQCFPRTNRLGDP